MSALSMAIALAALTAQEPALHMTLTPERGAGYEAVAISLAFRGEPDGSTTLRLPDEWGGETELWRGLTDLTVEGGELDAAAGPAERTVRHAPGAQLTVRYRVRQFHDGPPTFTGDNDYRPFVQPTFFQVLGNTAVIHPSSVEDDAPVTVDLARPAAGESFASDLEHGAQGRALTFNDLTESVTVGGDFRIIDGGDGQRLAIRGDWDRSDDAWRDAFLKLSAALRTYWGSDSEPYLVTILPLADPQGGSISVGGTGRSDAFAFYATRNAPPETLDGIMAHEMTHTWVPGRLGRMPERDSEAYWLSEGFTDWASWRAMAQGGLYDAERVTALLNTHLRDYDLSPLRALANDEAARRYWTEASAQRLPYLRGALLAARWDGQVRDATGGERDFDDVLHAMQTRALAAPATPVVDNLARAMREVANLDIAPELAAFVERGEPVDLPTDLFAACGAIETVDRAAFHRGFDLEATQAAGNIFTDVIVEGPAWRAGLRDGMKLVRRSGGVIGDSTQPITYEVEADGTPLTLTWLPEAPERERFRRLAVTRPGDACARDLVGSPEPD